MGKVQLYSKASKKYKENNNREISYLITRIGHLIDKVDILLKRIG